MAFFLYLARVGKIGLALLLMHPRNSRVFQGYSSEFLGILSLFGKGEQDWPGFIPYAS